MYIYRQLYTRGYLVGLFAWPAKDRRERERERDIRHSEFQRRATRPATIPAISIRSQSLQLASKRARETERESEVAV